MVQYSSLSQSSESTHVAARLCNLPKPYGFRIVRAIQTTSEVEEITRKEFSEDFIERSRGVMANMLGFATSGFGFADYDHSSGPAHE